MQGIYAIRNKVNGKYYVGSTVDFERGWIGRRQALRRGKHHNIYLQRAWDKYGEESFIFEVIEEVEGGRDDAYSQEQKYLSDWLPTGQLYNISPLAVGGAYWLGKHHSEESNKKRSKALKGIRRSRETRCRMSKAQKGHPGYFEGKCHTEATKQKLKRFNKGYWENHDHPMKGEHQSKEHRQNIAEAVAKPYPAFYNEETREFIPPGINLKKMCQAHGLSYGVMKDLKNGLRNISRDNWRLV